MNKGSIILLTSSRFCSFFIKDPQFTFLNSIFPDERWPHVHQSLDFVSLLNGVGSGKSGNLLLNVVMSVIVTHCRRKSKCKLIEYVICNSHLSGVFSEGKKKKLLMLLNTKQWFRFKLKWRHTNHPSQTPSHQVMNVVLVTLAQETCSRVNVS